MRSLGIFVALQVGLWCVMSLTCVADAQLSPNCSTGSYSSGSRASTASFWCGPGSSCYGNLVTNLGSLSSVPVYLSLGVSGLGPPSDPTIQVIQLSPFFSAVYGADVDLSPVVGAGFAAVVTPFNPTITLDTTKTYLIALCTDEAGGDSNDLNEYTAALSSTPDTIFYYCDDTLHNCAYESFSTWTAYSHDGLMMELDCSNTHTTTHYSPNAAGHSAGESALFELIRYFVQFFAVLGM